MSSVAFCAGRGSDDSIRPSCGAGWLGRLELSCLTTHLRDEACRDPVGAKQSAIRVRNRSSRGTLSA
jgi:hypothetical protein